jgi:hypothetical protein
MDLEGWLFESSENLPKEAIKQYLVQAKCGLSLIQ